MRRLKFQHWNVLLIFSIVMMVLGALLIYNPFSGELLIVLIGISLILDGAVNIVSTLCIAQRIKKLNRQGGGDRGIVDMPVTQETKKQELEIRK